MAIYQTKPKIEKHCANPDCKNTLFGKNKKYCSRKCSAAVNDNLGLKTHKKEIEIEEIKVIEKPKTKNSYYLFAVSGISILFSMYMSKNSNLSMPQILLGIALIYWIASFIFGFLSLNCERLLKLPKISETTMIKITKKFLSYANWQFVFVLGGFIYFIAWNILLLCLR
jgi:predicted RND superfamily exporter protein